MFIGWNCFSGELCGPWTSWFFCLAVYLGFYIPLENFSLNDICRHHHYWWRASNLDLYIALMSIEQLEFLACDMGHPFTMVIAEDLWHSHLLPSVWQWRCHYLFSWLGLCGLDSNWLCHPISYHQCNLYIEENDILSIESWITIYLVYI